MQAILLSLLAHGEHGAVARFLSFDKGVVAAFVHGARSRRRRADLMIGNRVALTLRERPGNALGTASVETIASRALLAFEPATAAALHYLAQLLADLLAEGETNAAIAHGFDRLLLRMEQPGWEADLARFELLLLCEAGFGLDLGSCALGGPACDLAFVSPRTGRALSRGKAEGQPWAGKLIPLPPLLLDCDSNEGVCDALRLTGHFLETRLFPDAPRAAALRARLVERLLSRQVEGA
jgi:DNA repair protein RecO (recombination protein O)